MGDVAVTDAMEAGLTDPVEHINMAGTAEVCAQISAREEAILADVLGGTSLAEARRRHGYHLLQRPATDGRPRPGAD